MNAPLPPNAMMAASAPRTAFAPSLTNPRKHVDPAYIERLGNSMKPPIGIMQPITARPWPAHREPIPGVLYEITLGECRWRGSEVAGLEEIPFFWRELSDAEAEQMQIIENLQREDISELEEAEGYEQLMKKHGHTVPQIAEAVGMSAEYVYARLKLTALCQPARELFYQGKLSASTALLVARIPVEDLQQKAAKEIAKGQYGSGDPMSYRAAAEHVRSHYMLQLNKAPFSRSDATLVPAAGSCAACPKRTGNQGDLFADVKSADVCTDPACYDLKRLAHGKQQQEVAKAEGRKVISGKDAEKIKPNSYSELKGGYVELDKQIYLDGKQKTVRQILGKDAPPADVLVDPHKNGNIIEVVAVASIKDKLEAKGVKSYCMPRGGAKSEAEKKAAQEQKRDAIFRQRLFDQVRTRLLVEMEENDMAPYLEPSEEAMIAAAFFGRTGWPDQCRVARLWMGPEGDKGGDSELVHELQERIPHLSRKELARLMMDLTLIHEAQPPNGYSSSTPERLLELAKSMSIDADAMKAQILKEQREKEAKAKGKAKPAAKAKAAPEVNAGHTAGAGNWPFPISPATPTNEHPLPNESGVYSNAAAELIELKLKKNSGAQIRVLEIDGGWIWSTAAQGSFGGFSGPLMKTDMAPTRDEAIFHAATKLADQCAGRTDTFSAADQKKIKAWTDSLISDNAPPAAAAKPAQEPLQVGDRVRILPTVKNPKGKAYVGKEAVISGTVGEAFFVTVKGKSVPPSFMPDELEKPPALPAEPASTPNKAAPASEGGANSAAPAGGEGAKAASGEEGQDPAPAKPAKKTKKPAPAAAGEAPGDASNPAQATPGNENPTPPLLPASAWPFPTGVRK